MLFRSCPLPGAGGLPKLRRGRPGAMLAKAERFPNARARVGFYPGCQGTPRVKRFQKSRLFSDRGGKAFFMVGVSQRKLFSVRGFVRLRGRGRGFSLWWCSILAQGGKAASPASACPWRTPANRSGTRLFSVSKSAAFRGSQQPLVAFPLEEPTRNFPPVCMN